MEAVLHYPLKKWMKEGTLPILMSRLTNQIVLVCALLTNFQPALVLAEDQDDSTVEKYFTDDDSSTEDSDTSVSAQAFPCNILNTSQYDLYSM